jgi:hypothetical protein
MGLQSRHFSNAKSSFLRQAVSRATLPFSLEPSALGSLAALKAESRFCERLGRYPSLALCLAVLNRYPRLPRFARIAPLGTSLASPKVLSPGRTEPSPEGSAFVRAHELEFARQTNEARRARDKASSLAGEGSAHG